MIGSRMGLSLALAATLAACGGGNTAGGIAAPLVVNAGRQPPPASVNKGPTPVTAAPATSGSTAPSAPAATAGSQPASSSGSVSMVADFGPGTLAPPPAGLPMGSFTGQKVALPTLYGSYPVGGSTANVLGSFGSPRK